MKHPLRLLIHVPLREKRDFRQMLVGLKGALCVSLNGTITTYDLLPTLKPRKGQEHHIIEKLAEQLNQGWTLAVWDVDRLLRDLEQIVESVRSARPRLISTVEAAWNIISSADEEHIVDLKAFVKFPNGHLLAAVESCEHIDLDVYTPRLRKRLKAAMIPKRPVAEDFWGVLHALIMTKTEADLTWGAYRRWVKSNRPRPPRTDMDKPAVANQSPLLDKGA